MNKEIREAAAKRAGRPTPGQKNYLHILFNDCGFTTLLLRNDFLSRRYKRTITYVDDLTFMEAHGLISELKERRDGLRDYLNKRDDEEEA